MAAQNNSSTPKPQQSGEQTYQSLISFFNTYSTTTIEFDILPSSFSVPTNPPILQDGPALAIRKKDLVPAFLIARKIFFSKDSPPQDPPSLSKQAQQAILDSTAVILFFDPEHLTAANWRKRYLTHLARLAGLGSSTSSQKQNDLERSTDSSPTSRQETTDKLASALQEDLALTASLLTSPLKRHSKSPTLFQHRLWVYEAFLPQLLGAASTCSPSALSSTSLWQTEFPLALRAADRHFANYTAFAYLRKLAATLNLSQEDLHAESSAELEAWCFRHERDVCGWVFLGWVLGLGRGQVEGREEGKREEVRGVLMRLRGWRDRFAGWGRNAAVEGFERGLGVVLGDME